MAQADKIRNQVIKRLGDLQKQARQANEQRYANILDTLRGSQDRTRQLYGQAAGELRLPSDFGATARRRATRAATEGTAQDVQSLANRGLYNTTIANALARQRGRDLEEQQQAIDERVDVQRSNFGAMRSNLFQQQAGAEAQGTGDIAGVMERRTDEYPDIGSFMNLMMMLGGAQGQQEGGGQLAILNQLLRSMFG